MRPPIVTGHGRFWRRGLAVIVGLAWLAPAALASAQTPPPAGSGARMPAGGQTTPGEPGPAGPPSGPATPGKSKVKVDKEEEKRRTGPLRSIGLYPLTHVWLEFLGLGPVVDPTYDDKLFFIAIKGKQIAAWNASDGLLKWVTNDVVPVQPLVNDGGRVYAMLDGEIAVYKTENGVPLWRKPTGGAVTASPIAKAGWLIYALDTGEIRALRGETGEPVWQTKLPAPVKVTPVLVGDRLYVAPQNKQLVALDVVTGQILWQQTFDEPVATIGAQEHRVFVSSGPLFIALDHAGDLKWKRRIGAETIGQPIADESTVFATFRDNTLCAFGADKGDLKWRAALAYRPIGGPERAEDAILLVGIAPVLHGYFVKDGKPTPDMPLPVDPRSIVAAAPHYTPGRSFFQDRVMVVLAQGFVEGFQRQGPGSISPFSDPGTVCPPVTFPGEAPPPTTAATQAPPKS